MSLGPDSRLPLSHSPMPDAHVLVTGGTGFLGKHLLELLSASASFRLTAAVRRLPAPISDRVRIVPVDDIGPLTDWSQTLSAVNVVIHTAARVHVMKERAHDPLREFRQVNVKGTINLARQAAAAGVRRFIFISSIGVNGRETSLGTSFKPGDSPAPSGPYAISKREAEDALREIAAETGMEVVVIRPPLIYGPGAKGNFHRLLQWLDRGIPLPLGSVNNKRSMVALENVSDLIIRCMYHPSAPNRLFLAADGYDLATPEILRTVAKGLGKQPRLFSLPRSVLHAGAAAVGKRDLYSQLCCSLQIDISQTCEVLQWKPTIRAPEALYDAAQHFRHASRRR